MGLFLDHHSHSFYTEYAFLIDEEQGYCYIKKLLWYTDLKVLEEKEEELKKLLLDNLSKEKGETIVRTAPSTIHLCFGGLLP